MEPVPQVVGVAPGQGPFTVGEDTAPVPDGQGGALAGLDDPGGPADLQGWVGAPGRWSPLRSGAWGGGAPRGWWGGGGGWVLGSEAAGGGSSPWMSLGAGLVGPWSVLGSWPGWWLGGWRGTRTRVTAPSQASRRQACGSSGPAQPTSPPTVPGWPRRLSRSTVTVSWGRTPPAWGSRPASRWRRASSVRASAWRWLPLRASVASAGRANDSKAAMSCWPASGSSSPSTATMPSTVGASHRPRRAWRRARSRSVPSGWASWSRWPRSRRSRGGSSRRAASTSTASASTVTWSGRGWVPAATTWAWATDSSPSVRAWAVAVNGSAEQGPGRPDGAGGGAGAQVEPVAEPGRGRPDLLAGLGPGRPAGVDGRELVEPVAFQAVQQPPQLQDLCGQGGIGQTVKVLGG